MGQYSAYNVGQMRRDSYLETRGRLAVAWEEMSPQQKGMGLTDPRSVPHPPELCHYVRVLKSKPMMAVEVAGAVTASGLQLLTLCEGQER